MAKEKVLFAASDGEWSLNQVFPSLSEKQIYATVGGSFVSKFQKSFDPVLNLPNNVGAGRLGPM